MKKHKIFWLIGIGLALAGGAIALFLRQSYYSNRTRAVISWIRDHENFVGPTVSAGERCQDAVFLMPTDGLIGFIWGDSFRPGHKHQGIDIFGSTTPGETEVFAAYDGYLTRLPDWKSSLIIRVPEDPIQPGRQIWLYYTHLADADGNSLIAEKFSPGSLEVPVTAGDLLGTQGNYSGTSGSPVGVHLHFSIVMDDGKGRFLNELEIENTLDPSPYFNLALNAKANPDQVPACQEN